MKRISQEIEEKAIKMYLEGNSLSEIGKFFEISPTTVWQTLKRYNVERRTNGGINLIPFEDVINKYQSGLSTTNIANEYNVDRHTICNILEKHGIERNNLYHNKGLNKRYWETIDSYDKAYFLGFFITDGNVYGNDVRLQLKKESKYILETLKQKTLSENQIREDNKRGLVTFSTKRKKWVNDLSQYGVVPNKTFTVYFPEIPDEYLSHFIRGLIDGDGWITLKGQQIGFCGNETLVTQLRDVLVKKLDVFPVKVIKTGEHLYQICWCSKGDMKKIGEYIYQDKKDCFLHAKFENYKKLIDDSTEVNS